MNTTSLRYFVEIADCGSFSRAAEKLFISQPALSRSLQRLEEELGTQLFVRDKKEIRLTQFGAKILDDARQILFFEAKINSAAATVSSGESGTLTLGYNMGEGDFRFRLLDMMRKRFPDIKIHLHKAAAGHMPHLLQSGQLDVAFTHSGVQYANAQDVIFLDLVDSYLQLVVPNHHPFAQRDAVAFPELENEQFLLYNRDSFPEIYNYFYNTCISCGFTPQISDLSNVADSVFTYISAGYGIGTMQSACRNSIQVPGITCVNLSLPNGKDIPHTPIALGWNKRNSNPCLKSLIQVARDLANEMSDNTKADR